MKVRAIYSVLLDHCKKKQVTVITGMRRVGKSTAVRYILKQVGSANYLYLDCERIEIRVLFNGGHYVAQRASAIQINKYLLLGRYPRAGGLYQFYLGW